MSRYFIDHPVFAWVIAIVIMLVGGLAVVSLPVEQYPKIAPPSVQIRAVYPGASAETVENSVTQVIEQSLTGIDYLRYFSSSSESSGTAMITVTFEPEANPDIAQVQVQNRLQSVISLLPQEVQQQGVSVTKTNAGFLMVAAFYSEDGKFDQYAIGDAIASKVLDPISRVPGVGNLTSFGQPYAMRIWLDPTKLTSYRISTTEVIAAVRAQNTDVSAGQLGNRPALPGQQLNATITAQSRLRTVGDFENITIRVNTDGSLLHLKDVARIELGSLSYDTIARFDRKPAAGMGITLATGANALETARLVKEKIDQLIPLLPAGIKVAYPYDTTPFVKLSIEGVVHTLIEAVVLVFLVMFLFLQNFRATIIPTIAVPVVLLGTFGILSLFGFTINTLTMFAMVLAIGLLVDDAIVVVENVERVMEEEKLSPKEATRKSMSQITGALIGIALVLSAVFVPMAFFSGSTGAIYRQFSLTIVSAMGLSVLVALVLTPALCATILKPNDNHGPKRGFFGWFNRNFDRGRSAYHKSTGVVIRRRPIFLLAYLLIIAGMVVIFMRIPTSFLPDEDQGIMFTLISAPAGATAERTFESVKGVEDYLLDKEKDNVQHVFSIVGFSFAGNGQNTAIAFSNLKNWDKRTGEGQDVQSLSGRATGMLSSIKDAFIFAIYPPAVIELGRASGFDLQLIDQGGLGHAALIAAQGQLLGMAAQDKNLQGVRPNGLPDVPQYRIDIDHEKAGALGLSIADINSTLQAGWGSMYVNDFINEGRVKRVYIQGDAPFRMVPNDLNKWFVKNSFGEMVPFAAFSTAKWDYGSPKLQRFNGSAAVNIQGNPAPGVSSGTAMQTIEQMITKLPKGIGYAWTGLSYEERSAGSQTPLLYSISLLVVFLCLAALYESWSIPVSVMMVVPLGIIGALVATLLGGLTNDVYFQVGLLTTVGLSAKNAILIVEFAKDLHEKGMSTVDAAMLAAEQRLRPILMTSLAFILGVTPLAIASGAGSGSQNAIGIGVIGGMMSATFLAIFFVPMFFVIIQGRFDRKRDDKTAIETNEELL